MTSGSRAALLSVVLALLGFALATTADGDRAFDRGDYRTAVAEYEAAYQQRTTNLDALVKLAKAKTYLAETLSGDEAEALYEEAAAHARAAIQADPERADAHMELARALGRLAQFRGVLQSLGLAAEVKRELERAIDLDPTMAAAYHALALWHLEVPFLAGGRSAQVRPLFERAIELEPENPVHHLEYGKALLRLGDRAAAQAQLEAALSLTPRTYAEERAQAEARELLDELRAGR